MIYLDFRKWIYICLLNPFKTMKKLKGIFKPLKCYFKFTKEEFDYYPVLWCSRPAYIQIMSHDVLWKDKDDFPRFENVPYIWIHLFKFNFVWFWTLPIHQYSKIDEYWEQALWYLYYYDTISCGRLNNPDIEKSKKFWPWQDMNGNSTWTNEFLVK